MVKMKRTLFALLAASLAFASTCISSAQAESWPLKQSEARPTEKGIDPLQCHVAPNLKFLEGAPGDFTQEDFISAAWFARAVQLPKEQRNHLWNTLQEKPLLVKDFHAVPFGLHATLLEFESHGLLLYRGTQDPFDYLLNAAFFTTPGWMHRLPGWVHKGFLINFGLTWHQIRPALKKIAAKGKSITFAAHSLGGVMSQYAAWRAENDGVPVSRIYAFQAPNPGDEKFKAAFDEKFEGRSSNVLYGDDITPHMPPNRSASREFGAASMKALSGLLVAMVKQAKYAALGDRFKVSATGQLTRIANTEITGEEIRFWGQYKARSGGLAFPKGLGPRSGFVADHNVTRVVCALAADNGPIQPE